MYTLYCLKNNLKGLSLSYNTHFNDECLRNFLDILPDLKLHSLYLSSLNATDQSLIPLLKLLPKV